jgi:hypothetical protein
MNLEQIITEIQLLKPSIEEVKVCYKEADEDYWNYLLDNFNVNNEPQCNSFNNLIEGLISCTDIDKVDFGGIRLNNEITNIQVDSLILKSFASFNENRLATNHDFNEFFYIDYYDPNGEPIIVNSKFSANKFISAILYLLELHTNFIYKNIKIDREVEVEKLSTMAGDIKFRNFFKIVLSQYE